jgi:methylthioribose-1-phosphate isomerase
MAVGRSEERQKFMAGGQIRPVRWENGTVVILDQTRLPQEEVYLRCEHVDQVAEAIRSLRVRGAPLIGVTAAYGIALAAQGAAGRSIVLEAAETLRATRPTARNLFWAIDRMVGRLAAGASAAELIKEAVAIHDEDAETCRLIGEHGRAVIPTGATVLTICNTGALATGGEGTALGVIVASHLSGNPVRVLACETRPLLQGARLNMWELMQAGIPATLIADSMAGACMRRGMVDVVIAGADRIARNGDTANKIGTYSLAVLAKHHGIPFYIAAPMSTVDLGIADGAQIPIEERDPEEVRGFRGHSFAPAGADVFNPAFDVTPAELVTGIVTEHGVARAPYDQGW